MKAISYSRGGWRELLFSFWAAVFLSSIAILPMMDGAGVIRYFIAIVSFIFGIISTNMFIHKVEIWIVSLIGISGILNMLAIGNASIFRYIYISMSIMIAWFLLSPYIRSEFLKWTVYINAGIICYRFWTEGLMQYLYLRSSNNYVSVYMVLITIMYYTISEYRKNMISLFPAILTVASCILGRGRGGILASLIMLIGVILYVSYKSNSAKLSQKIMLYVTVLLFICLLLYVVLNFETIQDYQVFNHFKRNGVDSNGRFEIWLDYTNYALSNLYYLLFGADYNIVPSTLRFEGNPHNSFLEVHALHGGFTFCVVLYLTLYSMRYAYVNKQWLYLLCFFVFLLRGFTDQVFWGPAGTPIFFFFLLIPYHWKYGSRDDHKGSKGHNVLMT